MSLNRSEKQWSGRREEYLGQGKKVIRRWRKLINKEVHGLYATRSVVRETRWAGRVVSMGEVRNASKISVGKHKSVDHLWDIGVDVRIILKERRCGQKITTLFFFPRRRISWTARHFIEDCVLVPLVRCYWFEYAKLRCPFQWFSAIKYEIVLNRVLLDGEGKVGGVGYGGHYPGEPLSSEL